MIAWKTKSKHTHSAMVLSKNGATGKRLLIAEALNCGPTVNYLSERVEKYDGVVWWFPLRNINVKQRNDANIWVWDKVCTQTGYDYRSLWKQMFSKVSIDAAQLFCSEMVHIAMMEAKILPEALKAFNPGELVLQPCYKKPKRLN